MRPRSNPTPWALGAALIAVVILVGTSCTAERPSIQESSAPTSTANMPDDDASSSTATTEPEATSESVPTTLFEATGYELDVVSQGAEPRFAIAIKPELDSSAQVVFDDSKELIVSVADAPPDAPVMSKTSTEIDTIVSSISNESFTVRSTIGETDIDESVSPRWALNALAQNMTSIEGLWIDQTSNSHLNNRDYEIQPGLDQLATVETLTGFADALALAQIPVPAEDLGLGAIWTTTIQTLAGGLPATVTSRATITEINDGAATADVQIEVAYHLGDVQLSNGPATLLAGSAQLTGQLSWTSDLPFALYELKSSSTLTIRLEHPVEGVSQFGQDIQRTYSLRLR